MDENLVFDERLTTYGRLVEAHRRLDDVFARTLREQHGLSVSWFEALLRVGRSPEQRLRMRDLADQIAITTGGATRLVDCLIREELIRRTADPSDRRVQLVELTDAGRAKLESAVVSHLADLDRELFDRLHGKQVNQFNTLLDTLRSVQHPDPG